MRISAVLKVRLKVLLNFFSLALLLVTGKLGLHIKGIESEGSSSWACDILSYFSSIALLCTVICLYISLLCNKNDNIRAQTPLQACVVLASSLLYFNSRAITPAISNITCHSYLYNIALQHGDRIECVESQETSKCP